MPKHLFDDQKVDVPCPGCGQKRTDTIGRFRTKGHFDCAGCGAQVKVDMKQFDKKIRTLEDQLKKMGFS